MDKLKRLLIALTISGNLLFVLWVTYNAIDSNFEGTLWQKLSFIGLVGLLILNTILILGKREKHG